MSNFRRTIAQKIENRKVVFPTDNFQYGKIIEENIIYAPYYLMVGNKCHINPKSELYLKQGWKQIIYNDMPELKEDEEISYAIEYFEDETSIYSNWVKVE